MSAIQKAPNLELFQFIAEQYAQGVAMYRICALNDFVPSQFTVRRWRAEYPVFGRLLDEAESIRAENAIEQAIEIADNEEISSAHARNAIGVRERLAARLDRKRWGKASDMLPTGEGEGRGVNGDLDPAQLDKLDSEALFQYLLSRNGARVIEGESVEREKKLPERDGVHPPTENGRGIGEREADPPLPASNSGQDVISTNDGED